MGGASCLSLGVPAPSFGKILVIVRIFSKMRPIVGSMA